MNNELLYQIALTKIPKVGPVTAKNLIGYCGGVEAVFTSTKKQLMAIPGIGAAIATAVLGKAPLLLAEREIKFLEHHGVQPLFYLSEAYPHRLKPYPDCPILLYYKGQADLNATRFVAIVGTRKPTFHGKAICEQLVEELKPFRVTVVSGLAYGVDITAHRKCLEIGIPTVAVLGNGLSNMYPAVHRKTAEAMIETGGVLTEFTHETLPDREHFPMRNRVVAGMCDALVVVETKRRGGSMITASLANDYHKDVFAFPGRNTDEFSEGCNLLIKSHKAALLEGAKDLAYVMNWSQKTTPKEVQRSLFHDLDDKQSEVVTLIRSQSEITIDSLTAALQRTPSQVAATLLDLEFKGIIRSLPGKRYVLV